MRRLYERYVGVAEIAQRPFQQSGERPGIRVADQDEVTAGMFHGVAQIAGFEADIVVACNIPNRLLLGDGPHGRAASIVQDMDMQIDRVGVTHRLSIADAEANQFFVFIIGRDEDIDGHGPI